MSEPQNDVYRPVDDAARDLARRLMAEARHAALAVAAREGDCPTMSMVAVALTDAGPFSLVSELAEHARALRERPQASLLFGTPGEGDPLAHPRLTLLARAQMVERTDARFSALRESYLIHQPKAQLYIDFKDFHFVLFEPIAAVLNGGFGRACRLGCDEVRALFKKGLDDR